MHTCSPRHRLGFAALLTLASLGPARAATLSVPSTSYPTIQAGITAAQPGDTVLVSDGTYTGPGNVDLDFGGKDITVASVNGAATTVIDCQGSSASPHTGFTFHTSESGAVVRGLTVKNGYESDGGAAVDIQSGAGVTLANCTFTANQGRDGAVANRGVATLTGCSVTNNMSNGATNTGSITLSGCTITGNVTNGGDTNGYGAGLYTTGTATLTGCTLSGNTAAASVGGGIFAQGCKLTMTGCTLHGNTALSGGGVYSDNSSAATLTGCTLDGNTTTNGSAGGANGNGGAFFNDTNGADTTAMLINCVVSGNTATGSGGGVYTDAGQGGVTLQNCTLSGNSATGAGAQGGALENGGTATLTNCLLWGDTAPTANTSEIGVSPSGVPSPVTAVTFCDIQGGYAGAGNISTDPLFVNAATGDFHIKAASPAIGAGTPTGAPAVDKDNEPRPKPPSIGAYERPADDATTLQINPAHTGAVTTPGLVLPLAQKWATTLSGPTSYPVIAAGKVFVTARQNDPNSGNYAYGTSLYALDAATGAVAWGPVDLGGTYYYSAAAYDEGRVFAINYNGVLRSFDAATGAPGWSEQLPGQFSFTSPPTAVNGVLYVGGAGSGGTLYAVDEETGTVDWTASVENGDESSPAVGDDGVYVDYSGPQAYKFDLLGDLLWHYGPGGEGGGGKTSVLYDGRLYVREDSSFSGGTFQVLDAATGSPIRHSGTSQYLIPAFDAGRGFLADRFGNLQGLDAASGAVLWTATGGSSAPFVTAPIVVNGTVYIGGSPYAPSGNGAGALYALDPSTGHVVWSDTVGGPMTGPDEQNVSQPPTGLAAGEGLLVVPVGDGLVAYAHATYTWTATAISAGADNFTRLLWDNTDGRATLWTLDAGSAFHGNPVFGPFVGWTAKAIATGQDNLTRLLWDKSDGTATVWTVSNDGNVSNNPVFGPFQGWTATSLSVGSDGRTRLLWDNADGRTTLWLINSGNGVDSNPVFGPFAGWTAKAIATGTDGATHLLWTNADGRATLWTIAADGSVGANPPVFGPFQGWTATALSVGADGKARLLWDNTDGRTTLWVINSGNGVDSNPVFGPFAGWSGIGIATGAGNNTHLLWTNADGRATPWTVAPNGSVAPSPPVFGPF